MSGRQYKVKHKHGCRWRPSHTGGRSGRAPARTTPAAQAECARSPVYRSSQLEQFEPAGNTLRTFCTTRHPYICNESPRIWPSIVATRRAFCAEVPYSNIFCTTCERIASVSSSPASGRRSQTHVIAKDVLHQLDGVLRNDLVEDNLHLLAGGGLQFLLDEARPVLISTELYNIPKDVLGWAATSARGMHGR